MSSGVKRKVAETMSVARLFLLWADSRIRSTRLGQAREHGGFPPPDREMFLGCAVLCLAVTQIKRVYVLHAHSWDWPAERGSCLAALELTLVVLQPF